MKVNIAELERRLKDAEEAVRRVLGKSSLTDSLTAFENVASAQRALAAATGQDYAVRYDIGFVPEAAVSGPVLLQTDYRCFLTFNAMRVMPDGKREDAGRGTVECRGCSITKFGYPNDEALPGHPLYKRGLNAYGVFEVKNSVWIKQMTEQNRVAFPMTKDSTSRHFIFTFHDSAFECVTDELSATLNGPSLEHIFNQLTKDAD